MLLPDIKEIEQLTIRELTDLSTNIKSILDKKRIKNNKKIYYPYINSPKWKELRRNVLRYYLKCCRCNSVDRLCVHHSTYQRLTKEIPSDLYVLCYKCHSEFHKRFPLQEAMKKKTRNFIRELNPKFYPKMCMPPKPVEHRHSKRHCKYCNSPLILGKTRKKTKKPNSDRSYYYSKIWVCEKHCTHGVYYYFDEDKVYYN